MTVEAYEPDRTSVPGWVAMLAPAMQLARAIAPTDFVPKHFRGREEAVAACILYGAELGLGPMQALQTIDVIEGRPSCSAEGMRALILQAGHALWTECDEAERVVVAGQRRGTEQVVRVEWSKADAVRAGLWGRAGSWTKYPRAMLLARATTALGRALFADVLAGVSYTPEEIHSFNDPLTEHGQSKGANAPRVLGSGAVQSVAEGTSLGPALVVRHAVATVEPMTTSSSETEGSETESGSIPPTRTGSDGEPGASALRDASGSSGDLQDTLSHVVTGLRTPSDEVDPDLPETPKRALSSVQPSPIVKGLTPEQRVWIMAWETRHGVKDREKRLVLLGTILGRKLDSTNDLNRAEATKVIDALTRTEEAGYELQWSTDDAGLPVVSVPL